MTRFSPSKLSANALEGVRLSFLTAEASLGIGDRILAQRNLLRIDQGDRRFELRPQGASGSVTVDLSPGLLHATLVGNERATLEIEWMVQSGRAIAVDAWAMCARNSSDVSIVDAFGKLVVADLTARDPSMPPIVMAEGLYLLRAETPGGPLVIRVGQSMSYAASRVAM